MKRQERIIRIYKDKWMLFSDWAIFLIGLLFIIGIIINGLDFITSIEDIALQGVTLIVFTFALIKIIFWVQTPNSFRSEEIIRDIYGVRK